MLLNVEGTEFLASLYQPPLKQFANLEKKPHQRARAAAWEEALADWLAGYQNAKIRHEYCHAVKLLLNFCGKLPWEVRQTDVDNWLEMGLEERAERTKYGLLGRVGRFYGFARGRTWISPAGWRDRETQTRALFENHGLERG